MKRLLSILPALALCLALTGCWEAGTDPEPEDFWSLDRAAPPVEEPAVMPSAFTLPYLSGQTLDPITCSDGIQQAVGSLLYEGLFALDERFEPQPVLCGSYVASPDGLAYTFTLRDGAVFSDGTPISLSDVLAAYRRAQISERYAARFANVVSMRVSRDTFSVTLRRADSAFPALLDIPIIKAGTEKDAAPPGTGPYRFSAGDGEPCLIRNETWWGDGAGLPDRIALAPAKDADTAAYLFSAKKAHLLTADLLSGSAASSLGGVDIADAPTTTMIFLGFNTKRPALADQSLRAAMGSAFDRKLIAASLLAGHADAAQFPISPASALYPASLDVPYAPGAYPAALNARIAPGAAEAEPLALTLLVNEEDSFKTAVAEYLAQALSASYVTVTPVVLPWADYLAALEDGSFDLWLGEVRLTADWDSRALTGAGGSLNYGRYANAALDAALTSFLARENEASAAALCELLAVEAPILPIVFKAASVLTPKGLAEGVSPTMTQPLRDLARWTFHFDA